MTNPRPPSKGPQGMSSLHLGWPNNALSHARSAMAQYRAENLGEPDSRVPGAQAAVRVRDQADQNPVGAPNPFERKKVHLQYFPSPQELEHRGFHMNEPVAEKLLQGLGAQAETLTLACFWAGCRGPGGNLYMDGAGQARISAADPRPLKRERAVPKSYLRKESAQAGTDYFRTG